MKSNLGLIVGSILIASGCTPKLASDFGAENNASNSPGILDTLIGPFISSPITASFSIVGRALLGVIDGATITAFSLNSDGTPGAKVSEALSNPDGTFTLNFKTDPGPILVLSEYGQYREEAASPSTPNALAGPLRVLISEPSKTSEIGLNPLTTMAVPSALTKIAAGTDTAEAIINNQNKLVAGLAGLPADTDVSKLNVPNTSLSMSAQDINPNSKEAKAALIITALSHLAAEQGITSSDLAAELSNSLQADGSIGGSSTLTQQSAEISKPIGDNTKIIDEKTTSSESVAVTANQTSNPFQTQTASDPLAPANLIPKVTNSRDISTIEAERESLTRPDSNSTPTSEDTVQITSGVQETNVNNDKIWTAGLSAKMNMIVTDIPQLGYTADTLVSPVAHPTSIPSESNQSHTARLQAFNEQNFNGLLNVAKEEFQFVVTATGNPGDTAIFSLTSDVAGDLQKCTRLDAQSSFQAFGTPYNFQYSLPLNFNCTIKLDTNTQIHKVNVVASDGSIVQTFTISVENFANADEGGTETDKETDQGTEKEESQAKQDEQTSGSSDSANAQ